MCKFFNLIFQIIILPFKGDLSQSVSLDESMSDGTTATPEKSGSSRAPVLASYKLDLKAVIQVPVWIFSLIYFVFCFNNISYQALLYENVLLHHVKFDALLTNSW